VSFPTLFIPSYPLSGQESNLHNLEGREDYLPSRLLVRRQVVFVFPLHFPLARTCSAPPLSDRSRRPAYVGPRLPVASPGINQGGTRTLTALARPYSTKLLVRSYLTQDSPSTLFHLPFALPQQPDCWSHIQEEADYWSSSVTGGKGN
jgi:hypothetical protein